MYKFEATYAYMDNNGKIKEQTKGININLPLDDDRQAFINAMDIALLKNGLVKLELIGC